MRNYLLIILAAILFFIGLQMKQSTKEWIEQHKELITIEGNRTTTTLVGAGTGAAAGGVLGFLIGGIGIAACGTGIGIPAGVVCLSLAAILGGAGAGVGAIAGREDRIEEVVKQTVNHGPVFSTWMWVTVLAISAILFALFIINFIGRFYRQKTNTYCLDNNTVIDAKEVSVEPAVANNNCLDSNDLKSHSEQNIKE